VAGRALQAARIGSNLRHGRLELAGGLVHNRCLLRRRRVEAVVARLARPGNVNGGLRHSGGGLRYLGQVSGRIVAGRRRCGRNEPISSGRCRRTSLVIVHSHFFLLEKTSVYVYSLAAIRAGQSSSFVSKYWVSCRWPEVCVIERSMQE
jgi:hypothetical protein